jgi:hypothetical protein
MCHQSPLLLALASCGRCRLADRGVAAPVSASSGCRRGDCRSGEEARKAGGQAAGRRRTRAVEAAAADDAAAAAAELDPCGREEWAKPRLLALLVLVLRGEGSG